MTDLTRESILSMPAGLEIDTLVAERVMGCAVMREERQWPPWEDGAPTRTVTFCGCPQAWPRPHAIDYMGTFKPYSTDIAAAWEVVESIIARIGELHPGLQDAIVLAQANDGRDDGCKGYCRIWDKSSMGYEGVPTFHDVEVTGATVPLAICRAALLTTLEPR